MPPPSSIINPVFWMISLIRSAFAPILPKTPSMLTTWRASAPSSFHRRAQSSGVPYRVAVSLFPCTSWTQLPARMSTAGKTFMSPDHPLDRHNQNIPGPCPLQPGDQAIDPLLAHHGMDSHKVLARGHVHDG